MQLLNQDVQWPDQTSPSSTSSCLCMCADGRISLCVSDKTEQKWWGQTKKRGGADGQLCLPRERVDAGENPRRLCSLTEKLAQVFHFERRAIHTPSRRRAANNLLKPETDGGNGSVFALIEMPLSKPPPIVASSTPKTPRRLYYWNMRAQISPCDMLMKH